MSPRTALLGAAGALGLAGLVGLAGSAAAAPPGLVEGREPDFVARAFHQPEVPVGVYVAPDAPDRPGARAWLVLSAVRDALLDRLTVPLGTAPLARPHDGDGA
jgi:hypothetical protein